MPRRLIRHWRPTGARPYPRDMANEATFFTILFQQGNNTGIEVPAGVVESLAAGKRPAVIVTVNGFEYRSTVAVMGGRHLIPFSSDKRAATGLAGGDAIDVRLVIDALAPSARKAHVTSVESAKAPQTRARRIESIRLKLGS